MSHPSGLDLGVSLPGTVRAAVLTECSCGVPVYIGWDDDMAALEAVADVTPIPDHLTEIALWLGNRRTYLVLPCGFGVKLFSRSAMATAAARGQLSATVVGEHCCEEHE